MENKEIYKAMAEIMKDVSVIKKEKTNSQGASFKYRGIDDVMNSLHNSFAEHGVFLTTEVISRTEIERQSKSGGALFYVTDQVRFTFHAKDGSNVSSVMYGTAMDSGDKADNKCMSIALKYCLLQAFLIPTDDMADPDSTSHEVAGNAPAQAPKITPSGEVLQPNKAGYPDDNRPWLSEKQKNSIIDQLNKGDLTVSGKAAKEFRMKKQYREEIQAAFNLAESLEGSQDRPEPQTDLPF